jgi:hypothetical protein
MTPGAALDAAYGTGRHTRRLVELGHNVVGSTCHPRCSRWPRGRLPTPCSARATYAPCRSMRRASTWWCARWLSSTSPTCPEPSPS